MFISSTIYEENNPSSLKAPCNHFSGNDPSISSRRFFPREMVKTSTLFTPLSFFVLAIFNTSQAMLLLCTGAREVAFRNIKSAWPTSWSTSPRNPPTATPSRRRTNSSVSPSLTATPKDNGPDYSRKVLCIGSKTSCLEQLAKLGGTVSPFPDVFMKEPSTGNLVKRLKIKKEKLTEQELRAQIDAKKPKGGRKGFIPLLNRSPSPRPRAVAPTPLRPSFSSHSSRDSSPVPPMAIAAVAASPISSAELSAVKESLDELRKERQADRALLESIADRMLCKTGLKCKQATLCTQLTLTDNGPDFMEEQEVGHLSLHTASHFAFVRSLFDLIAEDEEEKKLEIEKRDRFKIRWVEEQYRKFRHPNPNGFSSGWKDTLRQFRKTLRRRDVRAKEHQTNTPLASPNHTTTD
ncbi:hypothetical protein PRIPAC_78214 [Pristionchus pacificus]|uniref:Uncharacterized protein n=1 Tax=Pristionchus pacificus TaxID=54126 RepID=A0A2A6CJZ1_PRIPA|nr:hypothetical protein PRIPAC_78214 [Pristionchus pacificus]|eukprot:PDM78545.1 hypothetical protein PRIPAC_31124 [Pristionchus pacificus]